MPALELQGLSKRYGETIAIDDLGFAVEAGQVFGFVGPNGAGKTTTMRIVMGVLAADAGSVRWQGAEVDTTPAHALGTCPRSAACIRR